MNSKWYLAVFIVVCMTIGFFINRLCSAPYIRERLWHEDEISDVIYYLKQINNNLIKLQGGK